MIPHYGPMVASSTAAGPVGGGTTGRQLSRYVTAGDADPELRQAVSRLRELARGHPDLADRAARLEERIAAGQFHLAVLGEFKRGKSTLVNALVGRELLPTGVVPLTAVPTEVHLGTEGSTAVLVDGRRVDIPAGGLADFVTERRNPGNVQGVARVEVGAAAWPGAAGVVLVDTPGVASVNQHNTAAAGATLAESDAAIVVLSADSPLSESEAAILAELGARRERVFVVINKCDHVDDDDLDEIKRFVIRHLGRHLPTWNGPYCTDARGALRAGSAAPSRGVLGVASLKEELSNFVRDHLASVRRSTAVAELGRLTRQLDQTVQVEAVAATLDEAALRTQLERFEEAASTGRRALEEDRVVLDHDARALVDDAGRRLSDLVREAAIECRPMLESTVRSVPAWRLGDEMRDVVEQCVRERFEPVRRRVAAELEVDWDALAGSFAERAQERIRALTGTVDQLFGVHLPEVALPPVTSQPERFSYLFVRVESPTAPVGHLLAMLLPGRLARRRALQAARRRLLQELDKHAGRARYDIGRRLEGAKQELVASMLAEYERTRDSLVGAAEGARSLLTLSGGERAAYDRLQADVRALVDAADRLAASGGADDAGPLRDNDS